jgi:hypothetical protein
MKYQYDGPDSRSKVVNPLGCRTNMMYDSSGRDLKIINPPSYRVTVIYDAGPVADVPVVVDAPREEENP